MHTAQRVGQTVACGACGHVIGVQGTARAAAGSDGEVLLAVLDGPLLVGAGNQMLEADGVGGVAGDGALNVLLLHNGNAFHNVVSAVALNSSALTLGEGDLLDDGQGLGGDIVLGLHIGEAVDTGNDVSCILAQAVQDDAQGGLADLVCGAGDADGTLSSCKGLVACQESEAGGVLAQQTSAQIAVAQTDLTLLSDRAGDGEGFQTFADGSSTLGSIGQAALDGDSGAQGVCPDSVIKADGLNAAHDLVAVDALCEEHLVASVQRLQAVSLQACLDFRHAAIHRFKSCHELFLLSYSSRGSMYFTAPCSLLKRP